MSIDPRKGKKRIDMNRAVRVSNPQSMPLDMVFDLFYSAKRAEQVRDRTLAGYKSYCAISVNGWPKHIRILTRTPFLCFHHVQVWLSTYRSSISDIETIITEEG